MFVSALFGVIALVNLIQLVVGRQLVRPSRDQRTGGQLRRDSAVGAVVGVGGLVMAVSPGWGFALIFSGFVAQELMRRSARQE